MGEFGVGKASGVKIDESSWHRRCCFIGVCVIVLGLLSLAGGRSTLLAQNGEETAEQEAEQEEEGEEGEDGEDGEEDSVKDEQEPPEGPLYPVSEFSLSYARDVDSQPALDKFDGMVLEFGEVEDGLAAPGEGRETVEWKLGQPPEESRKLYGEAVRAACSQIVETMQERGYLGVYVVVDENDIDTDSGEDLRDEDQTLNLSVWTTEVKNVRTVASGDRVPEDKRINNPVHEKIRDRSPVTSGETLKRDAVEDYIYRLNRHAGRNVDMAVSSAGEPGEAVLDYMVAENKPWTAYVGAENTGTESTDEWRERFGFTHRQLTGRDDVLSLDYVTTSFDEVHALMGSYKIPVKWLQSDAKVYGNWNEYTASEVGLAEEAFEGESWGAGGELSWNIYQNGPLFLDVLGGARFEHARVENKLFGVEGEEDFLLPYVGLELERKTRKARTGLSLDVEHNLAGAAATSEDEIQRLGRLETDKHWTVAHWNVYHSFFLEPLIFGSDFDDFDTPESSTLAHEILMELKGQYAFDRRLVPQAQMVAGGTYTVRGYPESAVAGDNVYVARGEYRFHLPKALRPQSTPAELPMFGRPFRVAPQHTFGNPDWDLQLKAFVDWGMVENNDRLEFEEDETMLGAGLGLELQVLSNLHFRAEWGRALESVRSEEIDAGNEEWHLGVTLMY